MNPDVRMRGFPSRAAVAVALNMLEQRISPLPLETIALQQAPARILGTDITAEVAIPPFARAAMDGYALRASDTFAASAQQASELDVIGEVLPGRPFSGEVGTNQAVRIMTGAPLPRGADAIVPVEAAEEVAPPHVPTRRVRLFEAVPPGRHVGQIGEDIALGAVVLRAGRHLRPQDLGVLASLGVGRIPVVRQPRVAILISGDELLPCGSRPEGYRIVDSNSIMLQALLQRDHAPVQSVVMVRDQPEAVSEALKTALRNSVDAILLSGGSSVGQEDHAPRVVAQLGELALHGVAVRPAAPFGIGFIHDRPIFLIPGNPVACLCAYDLFVGPAVRRLGGRCSAIALPSGARDEPYRSILLPLRHQINSVVGRLDYVRVNVTASDVNPLAPSGGSILSSTTRADGFVLVPAESAGHGPGETVRVFLYD